MTDTYRSFNYGRNSNADAGGIAAVLADIATLNALQVTMDGVDDGDNSANVATMATNMATLAADVKAMTAGSSGAVVTVSVDTTICTSVSALRTAFNNILAQAEGRMSP